MNKPPQTPEDEEMYGDLLRFGEGTPDDGVLPYGILSPFRPDLRAEVFGAPKPEGPKKG